MSERPGHLPTWPRTAALVSACTALGLAATVVGVEWTWQYYWHVESAMQFVFVVGPLAIFVFVVSLAMQAFRACRSMLAILLLLLWLLIAVAYFVSGGPG